MYVRDSANNCSAFQVESAHQQAAKIQAGLSSRAEELERMQQANLDGTSPHAKAKEGRLKEWEDALRERDAEVFVPCASQYAIE